MEKYKDSKGCIAIYGVNQPKKSIQIFSKLHIQWWWKKMSTCVFAIYWANLHQMSSFKL